MIQELLLFHYDSGTEAAVIMAAGHTMKLASVDIIS